MTYGEVRKIFYALIDEYAPDNVDFTEDEDALDKCANLFAPVYQEMANKKPIYKTRNYEITGTGETSYTQYTLPSGYKQLKKVNVLDKNNCKITGDYYFIGQKYIYISNKTTATYIIEYTVEPTVITDDTEDDFELEIDQDAQMLLPYAVASHYLMTDPSADYSAFETIYQRMLQNFDSRKKGVMVEIEEGEL